MRNAMAEREAPRLGPKSEVQRIEWHDIKTIISGKICPKDPKKNGAEWRFELQTSYRFRH
jgi:hypothetical protein